MASNSINGPNLGRYDAKHLSVTQRFTPSVAPHVLKDLKSKYELELEDLDVEELLALLTQDELELSEEAMDLLKKFKKKKKKKRGRGHQDDSEEAFLELLDQIDEHQVKAPVVIPAAEVAKPFIPPVIQLSNHNPNAIRPAASKRPPSAQEEEDDFLRLSRPGRIAMAMVAICPSKRSAKKVAKDLEVFGSEVVSDVKRFGTRIIVVPAGEPISSIKLNDLYLFGQGEKTHDGRDWSTVRGAYSAKRRVIVLGEELLNESRRSGRSVIRHEFAHAYEDVWSTKRKRKFPLGVELWYRFESTRKAFISEYASTKPAEYFAESVEAYFSPQHRERLRAADPGMFDYLTELLN